MTTDDELEWMLEGVVVAYFKAIFEPSTSRSSDNTILFIALNNHSTPVYMSDVCRNIVGHNIVLPFVQCYSTGGPRRECKCSATF
jgi:hypothetical protein